MKHALFIALGLILGGCASAPQSLDPAVLYARAIEMVINGDDATGTFVAPQSGRYRIEIRSKGAMDLLLIKSCHREWWGEKVGSHGWFQKENKYVYDYIPVSGLEDTECPLNISAYDAKSGVYAWGYVDFTEPAYSLPAKLQCNGSLQSFSGVSICQSRKGLVQAIQFPVDVIAKPDKGCELEAGKEFSEGRQFVFEMPSGTCFYTFMEKDQPRRKHRLSAIGYSDFVIQEQ